MCCSALSPTPVSGCGSTRFFENASKPAALSAISVTLMLPPSVCSEHDWALSVFGVPGGSASRFLVTSAVKYVAQAVAPRLVQLPVDVLELEALPVDARSSCEQRPGALASAAATARYAMQRVMTSSLFCGSADTQTRVGHGAHVRRALLCPRYSAVIGVRRRRASMRPVAQAWRARAPGRVDDAGRVVVHVAGDDGAGGPVGVVSRGAAAPIRARAVMAAARLTPNGHRLAAGMGDRHRGLRGAPLPNGK